MFFRFTQLTGRFVKEALGTTVYGITLILPSCPPSKSKPNLNLKTRKKKPSVLFCEHSRLFRERKRRRKTTTLFDCLVLFFEFLHSVGLVVGKRVDLWEFNHPRLQPLHDMIEIRRYIYSSGREGKKKNLHDPEIVPSVSLFSLFNDSEGIGFFFSRVFFKLFPVHTTRIFPTFSRKNKQTTSLNWSRSLCVSRTIIHDALQKCKRKSFE